MDLNFKGLREKPSNGQLCVCRCPDWCELGYQVATWTGTEFEYPEQPNYMFNDSVIAWLPLDCD